MHMLNVPPKFLEPPLRRVRMMEKILGMNSMMQVLPSSSSAHFGYHVGHTGKSVGPLGK